LAVRRGDAHGFAARRLNPFQTTAQPCPLYQHPLRLPGRFLAVQFRLPISFFALRVYLKDL
jgi:hypothetical protein